MLLHYIFWILERERLRHAKCWKLSRDRRVIALQSLSNRKVVIDHVTEINRVRDAIIVEVGSPARLKIVSVNYVNVWTINYVVVVQVSCN